MENRKKDMRLVDVSSSVEQMQGTNHGEVL